LTDYESGAFLQMADRDSLRSAERSTTLTTGARILVAEDDEDIQALLKKTLEREGHVVIQAFAGSGLRRALELDLEHESEKPDLIVLDLALPDADGRDLLSSLKRNPKTAMIPVIVWSGRDANSDRLVTLTLGAEDYVEKGPPESLVRKIDRILFRLRESKL